LLEDGEQNPIIERASSTQQEIKGNMSIRPNENNGKKQQNKVKGN